MTSPTERTHFMRRALELARRGWGNTHPNPMVGAVIVEDGAIVGEGWHEQAGQAHAEVRALESLGRPPSPGATLYLTMEPCSTSGRTGPCTEALLRSGLRHVVVATTDPNPAHAGRGLDILRSAGIQVDTRLLEEECRDLNLLFNHWITRQTPLLAGKTACTLDGKIATRSGESKWITAEPARQDVMWWRRLFPSIAIGAGTLLDDQPRLTSRINGQDEWCPIRFVFDGFLRTAMEKNLPSLYTDEWRQRTIVVTTNHAGTGYMRRLEREGILVWVLPASLPRVPIQLFRDRCREEGIIGVFIEGGSRLLSEVLASRELDYLFMYRAPLLFADEKAKSVMKGIRTERLTGAVRLEEVRHAHFGDDQLLRGRVLYPARLDVDETVFGDSESR